MQVVRHTGRHVNPSAEENNASDATRQSRLNHFFDGINSAEMESPGSLILQDVAAQPDAAPAEEERSSLESSRPNSDRVCLDIGVEAGSTEPRILRSRPRVTL